MIFNIDTQSRIPIYEQIVNQVEKYIVLGLLKENDQLPSVRQVAYDLGINPNTIQKAYMELEHRHIIVSISGKGSFITNNTKEIISNKIMSTVSNIKEEINILRSMGLNDEEIKKKIFNN
jgi:GntR family transcriptional regulator